MASERVRINVGGTIFETTRSTIDKLGSAYFARLLDPDSGFSQPTDGVHFIDRDPECFRVILNIARYGEIFMTDRSISVDMLEREADFYLLNDCCRGAITNYRSQLSARTEARFLELAWQHDNLSDILEEVRQIKYSLQEFVRSFVMQYQ